MKTTLLAAAAGLVAVTAYLVVERAIAAHLSLSVCLLQLLQWDASNAYGLRAFDGGWPVAIVGLLMDCAVSLAWAALFFWLYTRFAQIRRAPALCGLAFGVLVMVVMIFVVVPLGHAPQVGRAWPQLVNTLVAHALFFGLPVALAVDATRRHTRHV